MKTTIFLLSLLLIVISCGKDNKSGTRSLPYISQPYHADAEIIKVDNVWQGVQVTGNRTSFAINVTEVIEVKYSRDIVAVIYENNGRNVIAYNSNGQQIYSSNRTVYDPHIHVSDDILVITKMDSDGLRNLSAMNAGGTRITSAIRGKDMRVKVGRGLLTVTFTNNIPRALAIRSGGEVLIGADRGYADAYFLLEPTTLIFRHRGGVQEFAR